MNQLRTQAFVLGLLVALSGCNKVEEPSGTGGQGQAGARNTGGAGGQGGASGSGGASEPDCYENPTTHHEIINACTTATRVERHPDLALLNEDGSLPEL